MELEKGRAGLGLSLAGNRDRARMSVFVVGIDPGGAAGTDGRMAVGDELLEVSGWRGGSTAVYRRDDSPTGRSTPLEVVNDTWPVLFRVAVGQKFCLAVC